MFKMGMANGIKYIKALTLNFKQYCIRYLENSLKQQINIDVYVLVLMGSVTIAILFAPIYGK